MLQKKKKSQARAKNDPEPIKMEKTGDNTFNVHLSDGSHMECKSDKPLSKFSRVKSVNHSPASKEVFSGIGTKKSLFCKVCNITVTAYSGQYDVKLKKLIFACKHCKSNLEG